MSNSNSNGMTDLIPELRKDLDIISVTDNGRQILYFHDTLGYAPPDFALHAAAKPLLSLFNGHYRISDLLKQNGDTIKEQDLKEFIRLLDDACLLKTSKYDQRSEEIESSFEISPVREPILAGKSYPENPAQFKSYMDKQFLRPISMGNSTQYSTFNALYAPHIDIRVGSDVYIESFSRLKEIKPKKVLILATSHYAGNYDSFYQDYPFIGSLKSYKIPGRLFKTDQKFLTRLSENSSLNGFTLSDRAHRVEHSIETHLAYISAIWDHDFEIIPILIGSLDELFYLNTGDLAKKTEQFAKDLRSNIQGHDDLFTLISGDLSHVGKKFGDSVAASAMRETVTEKDRKFLETATTGSPDKMLDLISTDYDSTRICGFPPLYIYLKATQISRGKLINYQWWDESERESAVSYGSILY